MKATQPMSVTIRQIEFELEKAEHGMGMPYDAERVGQLRNMLVRHASENCRARWRRNENCPDVEFSACRV
jgi:endonuclease III